MDFSSLDIDLTAKYDSYSLYIADNELADSNGFGSETTVVYDLLATGHQDGGNDNSNDDIVDGAKPWLAAGCPGSASPGHRSVAHQASKPQVNSDIRQGSTKFVNLDVAKELEG
jgi:hypothetical protein